MMNQIEKTILFLEQTFSQSAYFKNHKDDMKYRFEHSLRVAQIGKEIALAEGFNVEAMVIGCLLHDIAYADEFKSKEDWLNHGRRSAEMAKPFLNELELHPKDIDRILYGIAIHVDDQAGYEGTRTAFAESIGEADNIDRFDIIRLNQAIKALHIEHLPIDQQEKELSKKINHLKQLKDIKHATKTSNDMWQGRLDYQINYYTQYRQQLKQTSERFIYHK